MDGFCVVVSVVLPVVLVIAIAVLVMIGVAWIASLITVVPLGRAVIFVLLVGTGVWLARKLCAKYGLCN